MIEYSVMFSNETAKPIFHKGNDVGILLIHGFTGSCAHMRKVADELVKQGYTVKTINLPGHATTEEDMGTVNYENWIQAVEQAVEELKKECKKVVAGGVSMGGVLSLIMAAENKVDACVSISAPMDTKFETMALTKYLYFFKPRIKWRKPKEITDMLDPKYDCSYYGFPSRKAYDLYYLIKQIQKQLKDITCPLLIIQSTNDKTIWRGSEKYIYDRVASDIKERYIVVKVPHVLTISDEYQNVASKIHQFVENTMQE